MTARLWLAIPFLALPAVWPLLTVGLPSRFDRGLHLMRVSLLDQHIREGALFPRWLPEMMLGRGYPLFIFYAPGSYYFTEIFRLLGLSYYDASVMMLVLLVIIAGAGMYALARDVFGRVSGSARTWASLVASCAYMYGGYFLTVNIYMRGAVAEAAAQAIIPWLFWSARRIFHTDRPGGAAVIYSLLLAGVVFTHTLMLLILPPALLAYLLVNLWQSEQRSLAARWAIFGTIAAMGASAFFWMPLLADRAHVSDVGYGISRGNLPNALWTWQTFLNSSWRYTFERPPQLGLVQVAVAALGAILMIARKRDAESWYFVILAIAAAFSIGRWAEPLWLSNKVLLSIQSPWRLLTLISLSTSLFAGAVIAYLPWRRGQSLVAIGLVALIVLAHLPNLDGINVFTRGDTIVTLPVIAQMEYEQGVEQGGEGSSFVNEFRPRWADATLIAAQPDEVAPPPLALTLNRANSYATELTVSNPTTTTLRFNDFYFFGWKALLDGDTPLRTYPSTNLGLLTIDVPPGTHEIAVSWSGTRVQRIAGVISLLALAALAVVSWRQRRRVLALAPSILLALGLTAMISTPSLDPVLPPAEPLENDQIRLLGYRLRQVDPGRYYIYPHWYVYSTPDPDMQIRWQIRDAGGDVVSESVSTPYFNASLAQSWPAGTLVDDVYQLTLPPGAKAGEYRVYATIEDGLTETGDAAAHVGSLEAHTSLPLQPSPLNALDVQFGQNVRLAGYESHTGKEDAETPTVPLKTARAGDEASYALFWQAIGPIKENYHTFLHLLDAKGNPLIKSDQLPGPFFRPPKAWDPHTLQRDTHEFTIPDDAPGGLYWPVVGVYEYERLDLLPVSVEGQNLSEGVYRLPPIKILSKKSAPSIRVGAEFLDGFRLLGYDLETPEDGLNPGETFTVTLYYRSDTATETDYTRFLHMHSPELGMAAQYDSPPQDGANPTWAWIPGETIVDTVQLTIAEDAQPGQYTLLTGFYDSSAGGTRLPVLDDTGQGRPDDVLPLSTVTVNAPANTRGVEPEQD